MFLVYFSFFVGSIFMCTLKFQKKILLLLWVEMSFLFLVLIFFSYGFFNSFPFVSSLIFLVFMVLESVLAISLFISSGRNSTSFNSLSFNF